MKRGYAFENGQGEEEGTFSMELLTAEEGKVLTLVIVSNEKLSTRAFVNALLEYANQFEENQSSGSLGDAIN